MQCVVDFIDVLRGKIVDFEILQKGRGFVFGDYFGPSNGMEVEGVRRIIRRWQTHEPATNAKVSAYVHDRDAKTRKLLRELWNKPELLDPNHILKGFERKLGGYSELRGLKSKLRRWFVFISKLEETQEEKRRLWLNSSNHYQGIHDACRPHPPIVNPPLQLPTSPSRQISAVDEVTGQSAQKVTRQSKEKVSQIRLKIAHLEQFLRETEDLFNLVTPGITTQLNESLHARKAKMASKDIAWQGSWPARVAAAVLDINMPGWRLELYKRLELPKLSPEAEGIIQGHDQRISERASKRQQPSEARKRRLARELRRSYSKTIEKQNPQYKGITKTKTKTTRDAVTHKSLDDALTARFPADGENDSDDDSDYQPPANDPEEEEDEDEEGPVTVEQTGIEAESSDDDDNPSSRELRDTVYDLLTKAEGQDWNDEDDELYIVQPDERFDQVDLTEEMSRIFQSRHALKFT
jgi:hypothetical protein